MKREEEGGGGGGGGKEHIDRGHRNYVASAQLFIILLAPEAKPSPSSLPVCAVCCSPCRHNSLPPPLRSPFFHSLAAPLQITVAIADCGQHFNFFSSTFVFHKFCGCFASSSFSSARFYVFVVPRFIRRPSPLWMCVCVLSTCWCLLPYSSGQLEPHTRSFSTHFECILSESSPLAALCRSSISSLLHARLPAQHSGGSCPRIVAIATANKYVAPCGNCKCLTLIVFTFLCVALSSINYR